MTSHLNQIIQCDCLEGMRCIPDGSVDCVVTSPPYNKGKQGEKVGNQIWSGFKIEYDAYTDSKTDAEYAAWMISVLDELHRVLKPNGSVFLNHKVVLEGCKGHFPKWVLDSKFDLYQMIVWNRMCSCNMRAETLFPTHELIFWLCKDKPRVFKENARHKNDIWNILPERNSKHPAPFPVGLADNCIALTCPDSRNEQCMVLDPFMGSGTTAVAAKARGHHYLGYEISEAYVEMANERLAGIEKTANAVQCMLFDN